MSLRFRWMPGVVGRKIEKLTNEERRKETILKITPIAEKNKERTEAMWKRVFEVIGGMPN